MLHVALQSGRKLNPKFSYLNLFLIYILKWVSFYNLNVIFITNFFVIVIHCRLFSFMSNILGTRNSLKKEDWQNQSNKLCSYYSNTKLTQVFCGTFSLKNISQRLSITHLILSKNALTNLYVRCVSSNQVMNLTKPFSQRELENFIIISVNNSLRGSFHGAVSLAEHFQLPIKSFIK